MNQEQLKKNLKEVVSNAQTIMKIVKQDNLQEEHRLCKEQLDIMSSIMVSNEIAKLRKSFEENMNMLFDCLDKFAENAGQPRGA